MIKIKNAHFIKSAQNITQVPPILYPEVAFLGRSNVGKSTFINLITGKKLAKSSATPGKTQLINYFGIEFEEETKDGNPVFQSYFVDLPGFGYAKVSKSLKNQWERDLWDFLCQRSAIKLFIHLVDSRHVDLEIDKWVQDSLNKLCRGDQKVLKNQLDSLFYEEAVVAIEEKSFILEADRVIFKTGKNAYVNSNTNFVAVKGENAVVQVAFNVPELGPNGLGGITVDGRVTSYEVKKDKKANLYVSMNVMGVGISAVIRITMYAGSNDAVVDISPNLNSNRLTLSGNIYASDNSHVFKGRSL